MKIKIESPYVDGYAYLKSERKTHEFRKENFEILECYYVCEQTKKEFTTTEVGNFNINQIYDPYRAKYNFLFPEQIKEMRESYGLNATQMSKILGLGVNMIRNYEIGEMPSMSNATLLRLIAEPENFKKQFLQRYEACGISEKKKKEVLKNIKNLINNTSTTKDCLPMVETPNEYTGYRTPDFEKLCNMLIYFLAEEKLLNRKLNNCLFYADFCTFKETGKSMSGMQYYSRNNNPTPFNYLHLYAVMVEEGYLEITSELSKEYNQEIERLNPAKPFNEKLFTEEEILLLDQTLYTLVKGEPKEKPWAALEIKEEAISYQKYAFALK